MYQHALVNTNMIYATPGGKSAYQTRYYYCIVTYNSYVLRSVCMKKKMHLGNDDTFVWAMEDSQ